MLTIYALMQLIMANLTLFLNRKASTIRRSPVPALRAAALILMLTIISLTVLTSLGVGLPAFSSGFVLKGTTGYFEVPGFFHVNQSPYVLRYGDWAFVNVSNLIGVKSDVTFLVSPDVSLQKLQYQTSALVNGSGLVNATNLTNVTVWVDYNLSQFNNGSHVLTGVTISDFPIGLLQLRFSVGRVSKGISPVNYSVKLNASVLGQQIILDFDPVGEGGYKAGNLFLNASAASVNFCSSNNGNNAGFCQRLNDSSTSPTAAKSWLSTDGQRFGHVSMPLNGSFQLGYINISNPDSNDQYGGAYRAAGFNVMFSNDSTNGQTDGNWTIILTYNFSDSMINQNYTNASNPLGGAGTWTRWVRINITSGLPNGPNDGIGLAEVEGYAWNGSETLPFPSFVQNSSNNTSPQFGQVMQYSVNVTANTGSLAGGFVTLIHNITTYGTYTNVTAPMSGTNFNVTFNITNNLKYSGSSNLNQTGINITANNSVNSINMTLAALFTIGNTAPTCTWAYPNSNALILSGNVSLNASCTDPEASTLTYYWHVNGTFNKTTNAINTTINFTKGNYVANVSATDGTAYAPNVTITFDLANNITVHHQAQYINRTTLHTTNISIAFTDPDGAADILNYSCTTTAGACSQVSNDSSGNLRNFTFNLTGAGLAAWTATITVNDSRGNVSKITASSVFPNTQSPTPSFTFPASNANVSSSNHSLNYTAGADADGDTITYYIFFEAQLNKTAAGNTTMNFSSRETTLINLSAYDGANWSVNVTLNYSVDITFPSQSIGSNDRNSTGFYNRTSVTLNYTWTEAHNSSVFIRNGSRGTVSNTTPTMNASYFRFTFAALDDANYTFSAWMNDTAGNVNETANITIFVDTTPPNITVQRPGDLGGDNLSRAWITLNVTVTEVYNRNLTVTLWNNATINHVNISMFNTSPSSNLVNFTGLADGRYNVTISANDTAGNTNQTANITFLIDTIPPIIENGSISPATATVGNPFTVHANISENNVRAVTATIAGANYTMTESSPGSNRYNVTFTGTNLVGNYVITDFYINDTSGNDNHTTTSLTFTATVTQTATGGGGGGGGGGGSLATVTTANGTIQIILNGTFTAKPASIERYDAYFPSGDGKKTWRFKAEANAAVKACVTTNGFYCTIGSNDKTEITIKRDYQLSGLANTYEGTVTLLSETGDNAFRIPVKFTAINLGITLPINVPGLHVLPSALAWHKPENNGSAQPRIWPLILLASSSSLPILNKAITRRKNRKKMR